MQNSNHVWLLQWFGLESWNQNESDSSPVLQDSDSSLTVLGLRPLGLGLELRVLTESHYPCYRDSIIIFWVDITHYIGLSFCQTQTANLRIINWHLLIICNSIQCIFYLVRLIPVYIFIFSFISDSLIVCCIMQNYLIQLMSQNTI